MNVKCIFHFQPIERYPPAVNFIRVLAARANSEKIHVITNSAGNTINIPGVHIHRIANLNPNLGKLTRILLYLRYILAGLRILIRLKPDSVLYYETISAGAPCIYKKWINRRSRLFIHYHEYTSEIEYKGGMVLTRWLHRLERSVYARAFSVSHTNQDRMNLFLKNIGGLEASTLRILPNHPPKAWQQFALDPESGVNKRIRFVYLGALSLETLYVKEMAEWVASKPTACYWDIYTDNFDNEARQYIEQLGASNIVFKGSVQYNQIPELLQNYDIGLILYKGHIPNYIYNVPNKLFEYYVCGLDLWFPAHMLSSHTMVTKGTYPKVIAIDFTRLKELNLEELTSNQGLSYQKFDYNCESTYEKLAVDFMKDVDY